MERRAVNTERAPRPRGPYNQAVQVGNLVFVSATNPSDPATSQFIDGDIATQTRRVLDNIQAILEQAGARLDQVVRTTVYLQDLADFPAMNEVYATYFTGLAPARSTLQVAALPGTAKLQMDAIAVLD